MKILFYSLIVVACGVFVYALWPKPSQIDTTGKINVSLYEGASNTWDARMQILPFDPAPSTQLTLRWQPPEETYNHFVLTIATADGELLRKESGEHDRISLDPDGLEPGAEYVFALQACLDPSCQSWLMADQEYRGVTALEQTPEVSEEIE